jgi:hypothetical protein
MRLLGTSIALLTGLVSLSLLNASAASAAAPVNASKPVITGTAREDQTLTTTRGTWQNSPTSFRIRWQRCDADGTGCVTIVGETFRTYTLDANDVGHRIRTLVTGVNADGAATAASLQTAVVSSSSAPKNTGRPAVSGLAQVGEELTADQGTWTGAPDTFSYQWQRCDTAGTSCIDVTGATGKAYGVRAADIRHRLRVAVKATNGAGSTTAMSELTDVVTSGTPAPAVNHRPTLRLISVRFVGLFVYARFRACDDSRKRLTIMQTDSKPGRLSYTRRFTTLLAPNLCGVYTRHWLLLPRFRGHGRYTVTLRARDTSGLTSFPVRKVFFR